MINNQLRTIFLLIIVSLPALSQTKPIIGVAGIAHESNSFNVIKTELSDFHVKLDESQQERAKHFFAGSTAKTTSAGYIEGAKQFGLELYPTLITSATPRGPVTDQAFNTINWSCFLS